MGKVEVNENRAAWIEGMKQQLRSLEDDLEWVYSNRKSLKKKYDGEFVAVRDKKVMAHNINKDKLEVDLREKGLEPLDVVIIKFGAATTIASYNVMIEDTRKSFDQLLDDLLEATVNLPNPKKFLRL